MRLPALLAVVAVLFAGCSDSSADDEITDPGPAPDSIAPAAGIVSRSYGGTLDLEVTGAVEARWSGATPISVLTAVGEGRPPSSWQLTVGLLDAVDGGAGWSVRPAFDLIGYHGADTYAIEPERPGGDDPLAAAGDGADAAVAAAVRSTALLVAAGHGTEPTMYTEEIEACTLHVREKGLAGSLECPRMTGPGGEMAVRWSWEADPGQVLLDERTGAGEQDGGSSDAPSSDDGGGPASPAPGAGGSQPGGADDGSDPGEGEAQPSMPLEVALDASCYERGSPVVVTITSEPDAALGMAVAFSDARPYGLYQLGRTDPQGTFRWAFAIPPEAPTGEGHVLVSAGSSDGERAASVAEPFLVEESC